MPSQTLESSQATVSSYFRTSCAQPSDAKQKQTRESSLIDLTVDSDVETFSSSRKRSLSATSSPRKKAKTATLEAPVDNVVKEWGFSPWKNSSSDPPKPRTAEQQKTHEAFKKKLLPEASSRASSKQSDDLTGDEDDSEVVEDVDDPPVNPLEKFSSRTAERMGFKSLPAARKKGKEKLIGPSGKPYTPLELQVIELQKNNPGTLLMVEVGYKYKFYGEDAKIAAQELGMVRYRDRNFNVAMIPENRKDIHLKKLLSRGHRVGIVQQTETAALKKLGETRNTLFERRVTQLYTAATYVDSIDSVDDVDKYAAPPLMCLVEEPKGKTSGDIAFGMLTISPNTGDVVWDDFTDNPMRLELETRLVHTRPAELLVAELGLSDETKKVLSHFKETTSLGYNTRIEKFKRTMSYTDAFQKVSDFYTDKNKASVASENFKSGRLMAAITDFPQRVVIALAHAIDHLSKFGLADPFLETEFFSKFATQAHMLLAANTLVNLEIYRNTTDGDIKGSLMWVLDKTRTKFGARLLRSWVGKPLVDKRALTERVDAVDEILESDSELLLTLRGLLSGLPDLGKGLCRIQYGQCTPEELARLLPALEKLSKAFQEFKDAESVGLKNPLLNQIVASLPKLRAPVQEILADVKLEELREGRKARLWRDTERFPKITDADMLLQTVEVDLRHELKQIRKQLKLPGLQWKSVANDDYLVEVRKDHRAIPDHWDRHSTTSQFVRLQPPKVKELLEQQACYREMLAIEANQAYRTYLKEFSQKHFPVVRDAINKLAIADCLIGFAQVALAQNYVRPQFTEEDGLEIIDGRHPMIEALRTDPYIPNSITIGGEKPRHKVLTGPNMGGKSSCVRMVALIALMAQIGSYVPAASVKMGLMDSILTRMGASDDLARGRSTFMVEMSETSEILRTATSKSLVILDELGRGTSTVDGMAIASATLQYLVETTKCKTLFITHYPFVASKLENRFPQDVENLHMGYDAVPRLDGTRHVVFLYRLTSGITSESFGIECGRLAGVPESILSVAVEQSRKLQREVDERARRNKLKRAAALIGECLRTSGIHADAALESLKSIAQSLGQERTNI